MRRCARNELNSAPRKKNSSKSGATDPREKVDQQSVEGTPVGGEQWENRVGRRAGAMEELLGRKPGDIRDREDGAPAEKAEADVSFARLLPDRADIFERDAEFLRFDGEVENPQKPGTELKRDDHRRRRFVGRPPTSGERTLPPPI